jgi:hypothetical protein
MKADDFQSIVHHFAIFSIYDKFLSSIHYFFYFGETKSRKEAKYDEKIMMALLLSTAIWGTGIPSISHGKEQLHISFGQGIRYGKFLFVIKLDYPRLLRKNHNFPPPFNLSRAKSICSYFR